MIWLASFPRSGNTFFRNVLFEVYGLRSSTYHHDPDRPADPDFASAPVVKTHLLPGQLPAELRDRPAVYLVRDGRDALVSIAHHRKDIVSPGTDFYTNFLEATLAQGGSFFGGWSENVRQWTEWAAVVIRFEDLIADPLREVEKLRSIMDLPEPDVAKLPTFKSLKFGRPRYGGGEGADFRPDLAQLHFRKGKRGEWATLPRELRHLVLRCHGEELARRGYAERLPVPPARRVVIEGSKLYGQDNDGVKRYLSELVKGLTILLPHLPEWRVELYDHRSIRPLVAPEKPLPVEAFTQVGSIRTILTDRRTLPYEKALLLFKLAVRTLLPETVYERISAYYRTGPFRRKLAELRLFAGRWKYSERVGEIARRVAEADLIHLPLPQHFTELGKATVPVLATIHDLTHRTHPQYHESANIGLAARGMDELLRREAHLLAVSESTHRDLELYYPVPPDRLHLVAEAADTHRFRPRDRTADSSWLRGKYGIPDGPYLLCLSTIEPRKNLGNTIRAFVRMKEERPELTASLVICGKYGWRTGEVFAGLDLDRPDLIFTGFVVDEHLPHLYAHARALCYVSHYEGFGLPILEAMACRTPVVYGDNSSLPEVAGPGGLPVPSDKVPAISAAMFRLLTDDDLWAEKSELGYRHAQTYSWLKTALLTLEVYNKVLR